MGPGQLVGVKRACRCPEIKRLHKETVRDISVQLTLTHGTMLGFRLGSVCNEMKRLTKPFYSKHSSMRMGSLTLNVLAIWWHSRHSGFRIAFHRNSHSQMSCIRTMTTHWRTMTLCSLCTQRSLDATPDPRSWPIHSADHPCPWRTYVAASRTRPSSSLLLWHRCGKLNTGRSKYRPLGRQTKYTSARDY